MSCWSIEKNPFFKTPDDASEERNERGILFSEFGKIHILRGEVCRSTAFAEDKLN
jgi:hypothetical protein